MLKDTTKKITRKILFIFTLVSIFGFSFLFQPVTTEAFLHYDYKTKNHPNSIEYAHQLAFLINQERAKAPYNLAPLKINSNLEESSMWFAQLLAIEDLLSHSEPSNLTTTNPDFVDHWVPNRIVHGRMNYFGYINSAYGENIAAGQATPDDVFSSWMGSDIHRYNILDGYFVGPVGGFNFGFCEIGIGYGYEDNGGFDNYWVNKFGCRNQTYPLVINNEAYETNSATVNLYVYGEAFLATEMRFSNDGGNNWSDWEPYSSTKTWDLDSATTGLKTVNVEIRNSELVVKSYSDDIILTPSADSDSELIITEINWAGNFILDTDQWIEIYNPGSSNENITDFVLANAGDSVTPNLALTASNCSNLDIPAGGYFLVAKYNNTSPNTLLNITPDCVDAGLDLDSSGEQITLFDAGGAIVDAPNY